MGRPLAVAWSLLLATWRMPSALGYECDAGRSNSSARAPCRGWAPGGSNATLCEVELGCCWLEQPATAAAGGSVACWAPSTGGSPSGLPKITNPALKWLGFFGQPDESSYEPTIQHTFASFGASSDLSTLATGAALGMTSLFRTQLYLVQHGNWTGPVQQRGHRLFPDYRQRWARLAAELRPWVQNRTIRGFHIGDELVWGGLPYADLDDMATMIAATDWGTSDPPIVFSNEGAGVFVNDENCFKRPANYTKVHFTHCLGHLRGLLLTIPPVLVHKVPLGISWISFDFYNPPAAFVRNECERTTQRLQLQKQPRALKCVFATLFADEQYLYPKMAPHQKALLIPDGSSSAHISPGSNGSRSGWAVPDMVARAREYFSWAASDTTGRVIGLMPWHWKTVNFTGGNYWDLGIESIPPLRTVWEDIGAEIIASRTGVHASLNG